MGDPSATRGEPPESRIKFRDVFRVRAFAVLYSAETQSIAGDQLARIALSVLVFERTSSAGLTALTYGVTYLPAILGGTLLARIGDRLARRDVMVGCDALRCMLFAAMALPGLPLGLVIALLVLAVFLGPTFSAAEVSYLSAAMGSAQFRAATGLRMVTGQLAQAAGFAVGGLLVAFISPRGALLIDAASYLVSAAVIGLALRREVAEPAEPEPDVADDAPSGPWRDRRVLALVALSALAGFFVVPEGLVVPFGSGIGASTPQQGLLLASIPLGGALGVVALVRMHSGRGTLARCMAVGCGIPLVLSAATHHWALAAACWLVSGALAAYQVEVMTTIVYVTPPAVRAGFIGTASAILLGAQGLGLGAFGGIAHLSSPARAIGLAGLVGTACAALLVLVPLRVWPPRSLERHHSAHRAPRGRPTVHARDGDEHDRVASTSHRR